MGTGISSCYVGNGEDAVQFAMREMPSLTILMWNFRYIDGYQVIQQLRDHPMYAYSIIMMSAYTSLVDKVRAYELVFDS
ncbi:response regulator [Dictyobacter formicarum]|uniref:Response regulatory domain-containing protein n=1 Tax=Dictyobacter formicarum TaxID=2778368 RepID=A0ABQ3VU96_9CHLR|nr:response regulator [Dictyobacter formicarum]GHO89849.1 hypothetical protein KSZ_78550 [Dictyobacter formicarum]